MTSLDEIKSLESRLIQAELGPDPKFFEEILSDDAILDGVKAKARVVAAHQPGGSAKFTRVEMSEFEYIAHGADVVVVTCKGVYEGPKTSASLKFMRVWHRRDGRWWIIAGSTQSA